MARNIRAVIVDLSGTLHIGSTPIPSCVEALRRLRAANIPVRFCSNTSKESTASLLCKLRGMGFQIYDKELFTSLKACKELMHQRGIRRPYLLLSDSALEEFSSSPPEVDEPHGTAYDAVVIGLAPERFTYHNLNTAFRILAHEHPLSRAEHNHRPVPLIATHKSRYFQEKDGLSMGPGGFVAALEYALGGGRRAEIVGKPEAAFFRVVLESLKADGVQECDWPDVAMVGDDIETDLGGAAVELKLKRILVKTGKYREGDENKMDSLDGIYSSFPEFVDSLKVYE